MEHPGNAGKTAISLDDVTRCLASRIPLYEWRRPTYQAALLRSLGRIWQAGHKRVLDIGGGTGIVAQAMKELFPVDQVVSIDIKNRYIAGLDIETRTYDGTTLPFEDKQFDCVMLCNVLHHVPAESRVRLLKECGRVSGTLYIKDHLAESPFDHLRLTILDLIGNIPFGGMTSAAYIGRAEWPNLAGQAGFQITEWQYDRYREGISSRIFPNRLEVLMRLTRSPTVDEL
jgi:SAM-dependent methyltransferase